MPPVQMLEVAPYLLVADLDDSAAFYREVLGFSYDPVELAAGRTLVVSRDGIALVLRQAGPDGPPVSTRPPEAADVYIWVTDVVALAEELTARGADVLPPPAGAADDGREMQVADIDGHVICFAQLLD